MTNDSSQLEIIHEAVLALRDKDRRYYKDVRDCKFKTPWDIDWLRLQLRDYDAPMPFSFNGLSLYILPNKKTSAPKGEAGIYIEDYLLFQFLEVKDFSHIYQVYKAFGALCLKKFPDKKLDRVLDYCDRMDRAIVETANICKEKKIVGIFDKLWKEMGGDLIKGNDVLGRRIQYYREIVDRYKKSPIDYAQEIKELRILG